MRPGRWVAGQVLAADVPAPAVSTPVARQSGAENKKVAMAVAGEAAAPSVGLGLRRFAPNWSMVALPSVLPEGSATVRTCRDLVLNTAEGRGRQAEAAEKEAAGHRLQPSAEAAAGRGPTGS